MRTPLDKALRGKLEKTVEKARDIVEIAVTEALTRLGISDGSAPSYLSDEERKLRNRLRAHSRQLGDVLNKDSGKQETELLVNEMSYEHWHRMLFARFLEQSNLLMYEPGTPVSLQDCVDLAEEEPDIKDGWELAGRLAQKMLPQIFRADSPVFEVKLSINHVNTLEELIAKLHEDTFQASDALGWCYQFWQNKKKKQVNESGVKIGAKELSPVTQLFTEPYMVSFLLDNALGAWWAKRRLTSDDLQTATSEQELRELAAIPGVPLEYLRFTKSESKDENTKNWSLAAGDFDKWPEDLSELKTLDPCCGSGHFLVAKFLMLVPMRMQLEALTAKQAIDKVIAENIHGLELDQRCVELAAFALALEAWRYPGAGGYRQLPELQLACSGMSIAEAQKEWKELAKADEELQDAIKWMQQTFKDAPTLGSLIDPTRANDLKNNPWNYLQSRSNYEVKLEGESSIKAKGLIKAANIMSTNFEWVVTNVPYLARGKQSDVLRVFCEKHYFQSKGDLSTTFLERCIEYTKITNGYSSIVLPQNFLFLPTYEGVRVQLLERNSIKLVSRLGAKSFQTPMWDFNVQLLTIGSSPGNEESTISDVNVSNQKDANGKEEYLSKAQIRLSKQLEQLKNRNAIIKATTGGENRILDEIASSRQGISPADTLRFSKKFWEFDKKTSPWTFWQGTSKEKETYSGRDTLLNYGKDLLDAIEDGRAYVRGEAALGKKGVAINPTGTLTASLYDGQCFDDNVQIIIPADSSQLPEIWAYCSSEFYNDDVREIDQALKVRGALVKVEFDSKKWSKVADKLYPQGLPSPFTNTASQWIFHGHPCASVIWDEESKSTETGKSRQDDSVLQVAVARLLGYRWPAELDTEMELAPEMREIIAKNKVFDGLVDDDGIVCIPAIRGEKPAVDRLEAILHAAYCDEWSATILNNLLKSVKSRDLNLWLRDKFFEQHSKLFQHRPFIWQIWDGLPDGFSALVNYHILDYKGLERLIYTYLDDWISTQIQQEKDGDEGAELRLTAARNLREQLEAILVGESSGGSLPERKGLDIFVRWKSLAEQPIGWNPDLNDGVRLNIRPFMQAKDVGKKDTGILRQNQTFIGKKTEVVTYLQPHGLTLAWNTAVNKATV